MFIFYIMKCCNIFMFMGMAQGNRLNTREIPVRGLL